MDQTGNWTRSQTKGVEGMPASIKDPMTLRRVSLKRNQPFIHIQLQEYKQIEQGLPRFVISPSRYERGQRG